MEEYLGRDRAEEFLEYLEFKASEFVTDFFKMDDTDFDDYIVNRTVEIGDEIFFLAEEIKETNKYSLLDNAQKKELGRIN